MMRHVGLDVNDPNLFRFHGVPCLNRPTKVVASSCERSFGWTWSLSWPVDIGLDSETAEIRSGKPGESLRDGVRHLFLRYHEGNDVVIVQWRRKLGQETLPLAISGVRSWSPRRLSFVARRIGRRG